MNRIIIVLLVFSTACWQISNAQTRPQPSLNMFNYSLNNPAAIGIEDYGQVQAGTRHQWVGIDGAPVTYWFSGSMRLKEKGQANENTVITKGHGLGINLYDDEIGPYSTMNLNVGYAYHLPLSSSLALSLGFAGGLQHTRYDISKTVYPDQPNDPAINTEASISKKYSPDLNTGVLLNGKNFFAGVSMLQILRSKFIESEESDSRERMQLLTSLGYAFDLDEEGTSLLLSGIIKSDFADPVRFDIAAKLRYRQLFWIGGTYRRDDAMGAGFGLNITKKLMLGYIYEWGVDKHISSYSKGSHEFSLGFRFLKGDQRIEPRTW